MRIIGTFRKNKHANEKEPDTISGENVFTDLPVHKQMLLIWCCSVLLAFVEQFENYSLSFKFRTEKRFKNIET